MTSLAWLNTVFSVYVFCDYGVFMHLILCVWRSQRLCLAKLREDDVEMFCNDTFGTNSSQSRGQRNWLQLAEDRETWRLLADDYATRVQ